MLVKAELRRERDAARMLQRLQSAEVANTFSCLLTMHKLLGNS